MCIEQNLGKGGYEEIPRTLSAKEKKNSENKSWEAGALITSLATLIVLPKEGLRNKEDILPGLSLCFFSMKWEKNFKR